MEENQASVDTAESPFISKKRLRRERARLREFKQAKKESQGEQPRPTHDTLHTTHHTEKRTLIRRIYEDNYKQLLWIPFILIFLALLQLGVQTAVTGDFINKGVSIKGGVTITVPETDYDADTFKALLLKIFPGQDIEVKSISSAGTKTGLIIEADVTGDDAIAAFVDQTARELKLQKEGYSTEIIGSSLGASFFMQTILALALAFLFMSIVVLAYFRVLIPSLAVVLAAFGDIVVTMAIINLMGMKISTGGLAAFLMLIGYSVDTDILLTSRVLKRQGSVMEGVYSGIKTGLMTTTTTLVAVIAGLLFSESDVLKQIMIIILIGLCVDTVFTWIQNAGLLRWYLERKAKQQA